MDFNFYKSKEAYAEKYYQLPKVFFTSELYKNLSNDSKIAYTLLKDRFDYSIANNWVDEDDNIYFIFTVKELMDLLNVREGKVSKIKKELEEAGLLFQKRAGLKIVNGIKKNMPNLLYLGKPEVNSKDVYLINTQEINVPSGIAKIANPQETQEVNVSSGIAKIANPQKANDSKGSSGIAKIANNLYLTNTLDTKQDTNIDTENPDFEKIMLDEFISQMQTQSFVNQSTLVMIARSSETVEEAGKKLRVIHNAKKKAENKHNQIIVIDDKEEWKQEIYNTLARVNLQFKTNRSKIRASYENYLFGAMRTCFENMILEQKSLESTMTDTKITTDWLNS